MLQIFDELKCCPTVPSNPNTSGRSSSSSSSSSMKHAPAQDCGTLLPCAAGNNTLQLCETYPKHNTLCTRGHQAARVPDRMGRRMTHRHTEKRFSGRITHRPISRDVNHVHIFQVERQALVLQQRAGGGGGSGGVAHSIITRSCTLAQHGKTPRSLSDQRVYHATRKTYTRYQVQGYAAQI